MDRILTASSCDIADEDYIDIEVTSSSSSTYFCYSINSTSHPREFEFQMCSNSTDKEPPITSPADELFYKGNLLPLHLPPRLQMVQKLLQNSQTDFFQEKNTTLLADTTTTTTSTPFHSCNNSPTTSCRVSGELNSNELFYEFSIEVSSSIEDHPRTTWSKKLKLIKQSSLGQKLKASKTYIKSLFNKPECSEETFNQVAKKEDEGVMSKTRECLNKYIKMAKKIPFLQIQKERYQVVENAIGGTDKEKIMNEDNCTQRRSFSLSMKKHSSTKSTSFSLSSMSGSSSSSLSSANSSGLYEPHLLRRSSSANSEIEISIEGAIAYCKESQQVICSRKNASEVGFCTLSASRIAACEDQEKAELCRG
ncbi:membrane-associated kinase regulator [Thalictrum thalictroides]|uniref:Membrane-associated kinase regulator n=1 Tax=Thalictrum thalictroides TaxID=46969 RepID=A0A7J6V6Y8_THATH|nr:membrane-associated kinase regulator [Thalictrum thalictroides]